MPEKRSAPEQLVLPLSIAPLLGEVRGFLDGLRSELPSVFNTVRRAVRRLPLHGQDVDLHVEEDPSARRSYVRESADGLVLVRCPSDPARPHDVLRGWYRERARAVFDRRAAHWAERMGARYKRISVRDQRTLWGSASKDGNLSFNWRLVMAPPEVLDYLVVHELAHLFEMNHSGKFWAIVTRHSPDWKLHRRWLREHSRRLKAAVRRR